MEKKERPTPQRLRGRGVEVPKALFYTYFIYIINIMKHVQGEEAML
jgi:hypothetical protein